MSSPRRRFHHPAVQAWSTRGNSITALNLTEDRGIAGSWDLRTRGRNGKPALRERGGAHVCRAAEGEISRSSVVELYNQTIVAPALLMTEPAPFPEDPFPLLLRGTIEGIELIPW